MNRKRQAVVIHDDAIINQIFMIREQKVMLDSDLAKMYNVTTGNLNKAVVRNSKRFPPDFMFQLTEKEFKMLEAQTGRTGWGGSRKLPFVFTEQGVAMLSGVLKSDRAIVVNIQIMRVFTRVRKMLIDNTELRLMVEKLRKKTENNTKNIEVVFSYFDDFLASREREKKRKPYDNNRIGFRIKKASKRSDNTTRASRASG